MKQSNNKYWYSLEYVQEIRKDLWHVWEIGITCSKCVGAFEEKELAENYAKYLNEC